MQLKGKKKYKINNKVDPIINTEIIQICLYTKGYKHKYD